jgi:tetratricopeptide (TPR) repeat protein
VTFPILLRRAACIAVSVGALALPSALAAQGTARPERQDTSRFSTYGNYLAARHANTQRDAGAAAAYYRAALRADPKNGDLLERAFISVLTEGDIDEAVRLAERLLQINRNDRIARLVIGVRAIKQKQYAAARQNLAQSVRGPVTDLTAALLSAWSYYGSNEVRPATETVDHLAGADWYALFKDLHSGMILDLAGNKKEAGKRLDRAYKLDSTALRVVQAQASLLSRQGNKEEALKALETFDKALPRHPLIVEAMEKLNRGEKLAPVVDTPQGGAAEVLYGLGASLGRRGGEDLGLVYLQLAIYLVPHHPLALLSLADLYETMKKPQLAINTYERVPQNSPLHRNAEIQLAVNLDSLERTEEAKTRLEKLVTERPKDLEAIMALGNILRVRKNYEECIGAYRKGLDTVANPQKSDWVLYYFRGICNERAKKWAAAEADLKKALELYPDQPHVLNYLGYSWIDQGINLDEGMKMIRRAVEQRPDDGYIVDSLGWAYYRIGNLEEATKNLERAVELRPDDPTINDHLGDVYWKVGRTLEAEFQWSHARDLKPEPEELTKILNKIRDGLPDETATTADQGKKPGNGG